MEQNNTKLKLIYKKKIEEMGFFPKNFIQLKDYFLSLFNLKSSEEFIFKIYPNKNYNFILDEDLLNFNRIRKIKILENPVIFIIDKDEEDDIEQIDSDNINFIEAEESLGFDLQNIYKDYDINKIKEELERKTKAYERLQKRLDLISKGVNLIKEFPKIEGNNNLEEINKKYKEKQNELNEQLEELEKLKNSSSLKV